MENDNLTDTIINVLSHNPLYLKVWTDRSMKHHLKSSVISEIEWVNLFRL